MPALKICTLPLEGRLGIFGSLLTVGLQLLRKSERWLSLKAVRRLNRTAATAYWPWEMATHPERKWA